MSEPRWTVLNSRDIVYFAAVLLTLVAALASALDQVGVVAGLMLALR